jgi:hypothetical protein
MKNDDLEAALKAHVEDLVLDIAPAARHEGHARIADDKRTAIFVSGLRRGTAKRDGRDITLLDWICIQKDVVLQDAVSLAEVLLADCANGALNGVADHASGLVETVPVKLQKMPLVPYQAEARKTYSPDPHRLLPQSIEAEKGALSSLLIAPVDVGTFYRDKGLTPDHFAMPCHAVIFEAAMFLFAERIPFDFIVLTEQLRDMKLIDQAGGAAYVTDLFMYLPTAANAASYVETLQEKYALREAIKYHTWYAERAYTEGDRVWEYIEDCRARALSLVERVSRGRGTPTGLETLTFSDVMAYQTENDANSILGKRWLCKGGSMLWIGQSGIGKSSLAVQMAITWAMGMCFCGIKPVRPLKSIIIQAENDKGDCAEMAQGVVKGLEATTYEANRPESQKLLAENVIFIRDTVHTGAEFADVLRRLVQQHKPDLVWIDPLLSYVGDDISKQSVASDFLRNKLNPIAAETGCCFMVMHHTGKPSTDPKSKSHWKEGDMAYASFGSSELVNWARGVNVVRLIRDGIYEAHLVKRGKRAGARDLEGNWTDKIYIQHSEQGIAWKQVETPDEVETSKTPNSGQPETKFPTDMWLTLVRESGKDWDRADLIRESIARFGCKKTRAYDAVNELTAKAKLLSTKDHRLYAPTSPPPRELDLE